MTGQPYADAVAALLDQGYSLEDITQAAVVHQALNHWLRRQTDRAIAHHAACHGNGHQPTDHCDAWYALHDALTAMHDDSYPFVMDLLKIPTQQGEPRA